jgi:hypothetical protein
LHPTPQEADAFFKITPGVKTTAAVVADTTQSAIVAAAAPPEARKLAA